MIRLTCTQCKTTLEMDDAFAGGVCRCQHCGTIQTVPSHLKGSATPEAPAAAGAGAKKLYQGGNGSGASDGAGARGTGLDDLADVVASSGLSRRGLRKDAGAGAGRGEPARRPATAPSRVPLLVVAGGVIAVLVGVIIWLATRGGGGPAPENPAAPGVIAGPGGSGGSGSPPPGTPSGPGPAPAVGPAPVPAGPHFSSVPIQASKVVYVIDRGGAARGFFDSVKASLFNSIESLGGTRQFAVIFCGRPEDDWKDLCFPDSGLATATPDTVQACRARFEDTQTVGSVDLAPAVQRAAALKPDAIYLITAKGFNLDAGAAGPIQQALGNSGTKLYTIDLTVGGDGQAALEPLATRTGGAYSRVPPGELK